MSSVLSACNRRQTANSISWTCIALYVYAPTRKVFAGTYVIEIRLDSCLQCEVQPSHFSVTYFPNACGKCFPDHILPKIALSVVAVDCLPIVRNTFPVVLQMPSQKLL